MYTGGDDDEDDGDDDLVSSLSASNWAVTGSKDWRGASRGFLRQRCRTVRVCHERCLAAEEYRLYTGFDLSLIHISEPTRL